MLENNVPIATASSPAARGGRDRFSTWSIVVIVLTFVLQLAINDGDVLNQKLHRSSPKPVDQEISTDAFGHLVSIDMSVKQAYLFSLIPASALPALNNETISNPNRPKMSSFHQTIKDALDQSITSLRSSPDSLPFARRVILLRGLLNENPLAPILKTTKRAGMASPLAAFDLSAKEDPIVAPHIMSEERFWKTNFNGGLLSRLQLSTAMRQLSNYPTLLYYGQIARWELCIAAGDYNQAKRINQQLQIRSVASYGSLSIVSMMGIVLFLVGIIVWIGSFVVLSARKKAADPPAAPGTVDANLFERFIVPSPVRIAPEQRKMRSGDLLDCFAIYLLILFGSGTLISYLVHLVPVKDLTSLSQLHLIYFTVLLTLVEYVGASSVAVLVLWLKARKLGASLATELGLSSGSIVRNMLYGAAGWGASINLLVVVSVVTEKIFHAFPDPSNPALPMLAFAPDTITRFALYGMVAIAAPFFEETFFRGVLLNSLLLRFKPIYACLITGLMFGGIHPVGISQALSLAALGFVLSWVAYIRKSLAPTMFAHFLQNSYAYLAVYCSFAIVGRF